MEPNFFQALAGMGPVGVLLIVVWILMKREERDRQDRKEKELLDRESVKSEAASRETLATALTQMAETQRNLATKIGEWTK